MCRDADAKPAVDIKWGKCGDRGIADAACCVRYHTAFAHSSSANTNGLWHAINSLMVCKHRCVMQGSQTSSKWVPPICIALIQCDLFGIEFSAYENANILAWHPYIILFDCNYFKSAANVNRIYSFVFAFAFAPDLLCPLHSNANNKIN